MKKQIILAVANGCTNTRQIAEYLNRSLSTVNNYFYDSNYAANRFTNGDILQWTHGKSNTLQLTKNIVKVKNRTGKVIDVGRIELK